MTKNFFREWLLVSIEENDKNNFKKCVFSIGKEWHVIRTVEKLEQEEFADNLWENRDKIKSGTYNEWSTSKYDAYSYESKVCFLINPIYYKIIYDRNNKKSLYETTKTWYSPQEWQNAVDDYYEKHHKNETNIAKIFEIDFDLWSGNKSTNPDAERSG